MVTRSPLLVVPLLACAAWLLGYGVDAVAFGGAGLGPLGSPFAHDVVLATIAALCLARGVTVRPERAAWLLIGAGLAAWTAGEVYYTAVLWDDASPPIPTLADAGFLLFPPCVFAGMLVLIRHRVRLTATLLVDGITAALAVGALSAALAVQTVLDHAGGDPASVATALAYPVADLVLLAVGVGAFAAANWRLDRTWALLVAGILAFWLADSVFLVSASEGRFESGGWLDMAWWLGLLLIAASAWQRPPASRGTADDNPRLLVTPLVSGAVALGLLVHAALGEPMNLLAVSLAAAAIVFVLVRLTLTFRQHAGMLRASRDEALTDALTGLGNRRALTRALDALLPDARPEEPYVLATFDLDGFKHYNDTFGHPAGDVLLARLGARLDGFVGGRGRTFRMGGDEFCVLLEPRGEDAGRLVEGAAHALCAEGEGYWVGCSSGAITLPTEARDSQTALRVADQRMYASKHAGRMSAARQARDVLLAVLDPRSSHAADEAEEAARRMGLEREQREAVRYATELHALGERVIAAAPSLHAVARLVAESREPCPPSTAARIVAAAVAERPIVA